MFTHKKNTIFCLLFAVSLFTACEKDFLAAKPSLSLVVPSNLSDIEGLLDNVDALNYSALNIVSVLDDNLYAPDNVYTSQPDYIQAAYVWDDDPDFLKNEWNGGYSTVFIANNALALLSEVEITSESDTRKKDELTGRAYFFRAFAFWELLQLYAPVYEQNSAKEKLGIILKTSGDVKEWLGRSNLQDSYSRVLEDLHQALNLLPGQTAYKTRPDKTAAFGLLARVYLSMSDYDNAGKFADSALQRYDVLLNYNDLSKPTPNFNPFLQFHDEVVFHHSANSYSISTTASSSGFIDTALVHSYADNDLRKELFFQPFGNRYKLTGRYAGASRGLSGIATDELYLMRAECLARQNRITDAMADLNTLMISRWKMGTFVPFSATTQDEALQIILQERRKQLLGRNLRWTDLRRLNLDPRFAITLTRNVMGQVYTLPPNDPRYTLYIPNVEVLVNQLVEQNQR